MIRAYANVKGLEQACMKNGKMRSGANLGRFVTGFNQRQGLFDLVDVGDCKEGADHKVRGKVHHLSFNKRPADYHLRVS